MQAETYAVANLAALNLIEAITAAYYVTDEEAAARHGLRNRCRSSEWETAGPPECEPSRGLPWPQSRIRAHRGVRTLVV
jgi:hypothetical protein